MSKKLDFSTKREELTRLHRIQEHQDNNSPSRSEQTIWYLWDYDVTSKSMNLFGAPMKIQFGWYMAFVATFLSAQASQNPTWTAAKGEKLLSNIRSFKILYIRSGCGVLPSFKIKTFILQLSKVTFILKLIFTFIKHFYPQIISLLP